MKTVLRVFNLVILVATLAVGIWLWSFLRLFSQDHYVWHQKLSVTMQTPRGIVSGSSVAEVRAAFGVKPMSQAEVQYGYAGEATVVEVAPGKYLFALLGGTEERFACAAGPAMNWSGPWFPKPNAKPRGEWLAEIPQMAGQPPVTVPKECLPLMVTFGDITDPKTVQRVDPDDLAASFGPGVSLKAVTLAVTDEPVTEGKVEAVLGWLGPYPEPALLPGDGRSGDIPFAMKIHQGDFIRRPQ